MWEKRKTVVFIFCLPVLQHLKQKIRCSDLQKMNLLCNACVTRFNPACRSQICWKFQKSSRIREAIYDIYVWTTLQTWHDLWESLTRNATGFHQKFPSRVSNIILHRHQNKDNAEFITRYFPCGEGDLSWVNLWLPELMFWKWRNPRDVLD